MEVQDYQILDQYSDEKVWCHSQLLTLIPDLYVLPSQPHILCSSRWQNTIFALTGITPDNSIILLLTFSQPVFNATHYQHFPSESEERAAYWVGLGSIVVIP